MRSALGAAVGAAAASVALRTLRARPPAGAARWSRRNARDREVSLLAGPAYAVGAVAGLLATPALPPRHRAAAVTATASAAVLGVYDDLAGSGEHRGLAGHLRALRTGQVTTGSMKVVGIGASGLLSGALLRRNPVDAVLAGIVVAGTANLANLLDLRPGRALKAGLLAGAPHLPARGLAGGLAAGPLGAAVGVLPADLHEEVMLGDGGANALGAALGVAAAATATRRGLLARAAVLVGLTVLSERVSFTRVIARTPVLRELDALGRLP